MLEQKEDKHFELRNGLVYRKDKVLFYVPKCMEDKVISTYHDNMGHVGVDKTIELIEVEHIGFPKQREKSKNTSVIV